MRPSRITTVMEGTEAPAFGSMTVTPVIAIGRGGGGCAAVAVTAKTRIMRAARMTRPPLYPRRQTVEDIGRLAPSEEQSVCRSKRGFVPKRLCG